MLDLNKLFSSIILPPFDVILLWLLAIIFFACRCKKLGFGTALLGILILYVFSIPYTAQKLSDSLTTEDHLTLNDYQSAQAIVILGAGLRDSKELNSPLTVPGIALERMRYAAYLYQQTHLPILISGTSPNGNSEAKIMAQEMEEFFHVPVQWLEERSRNTRENAIFTKQILDDAKIHKIILVTNQWHMQRAKLLFEQEGFEVLPASVGAGITPSDYGLNLMHFIPQGGAMQANMQLLKEWLGYFKEKL